MKHSKILDELGSLLRKKPLFDFDNEIIIKIFNLTIQMIQKEAIEDSTKDFVIDEESIIRTLKMLSFILSSMAKSTSSWSSQLIYDVTTNSMNFIIKQALSKVIKDKELMSQSMMHAINLLARSCINCNNQLEIFQLKLYPCLIKSLSIEHFNIAKSSLSKEQGDKLLAFTIESMFSLSLKFEQYQIKETSLLRKHCFELVLHYNIDTARLFDSAVRQLPLLEGEKSKGGKGEYTSSSSFSLTLRQNMLTFVKELEINKKNCKLMIKMIECERIYLFAQEAQKLNDQTHCDYLSVWTSIQYFAHTNDNSSSSSSSSGSSNDWKYVDLACIMQRCLSGDKSIEWPTVLERAQTIMDGSNNNVSKSGVGTKSSSGSPPHTPIVVLTSLPTLWLQLYIMKQSDMSCNAMVNSNNRASNKKSSSAESATITLLTSIISLVLKRLRQAQRTITSLLLSLQQRVKETPRKLLLPVIATALWAIADNRLWVTQSISSSSQPQNSGGNNDAWSVQRVQCVQMISNIMSTTSLKPEQLQECHILSYSRAFEAVMKQLKECLSSSASSSSSSSTLVMMNLLLMCASRVLSLSDTKLVSIPALVSINQICVSCLASSVCLLRCKLDSSTNVDGYSGTLRTILHRCHLALARCMIRSEMDSQDMERLLISSSSSSSMPLMNVSLCHIICLEYVRYKASLETKTEEMSPANEGNSKGQEKDKSRKSAFGDDASVFDLCLRLVGQKFWKDNSSSSSSTSIPMAPTLCVQLLCNLKRRLTPSTSSPESYSTHQQLQLTPVSDEILEMVRASKIFSADESFFIEKEVEDEERGKQVKNKVEGTHPLALRVIIQALHFHENSAAYSGVAPLLWRAVLELEALCESLLHSQSKASNNHKYLHELKFEVEDAWSTLASDARYLFNFCIWAGDCGGCQRIVQALQVVSEEGVTEIVSVKRELSHLLLLISVYSNLLMSTKSGVGEEEEKDEHTFYYFVNSSRQLLKRQLTSGRDKDGEIEIDMDIDGFTRLAQSMVEDSKFQGQTHNASHLHAVLLPWLCLVSAKVCLIVYDNAPLAYTWVRRAIAATGTGISTNSDIRRNQNSGENRWKWTQAISSLNPLPASDFARVEAFLLAAELHEHTGHSEASLSYITESFKNVGIIAPASLQNLDGESNKDKTMDSIPNCYVNALHTITQLQAIRLWFRLGSDRLVQVLESMISCDLSHLYNDQQRQQLHLCVQAQIAARTMSAIVKGLRARDRGEPGDFQKAHAASVIKQWSALHFRYLCVCWGSGHPDDPQYGQLLCYQSKSLRYLLNSTILNNSSAKSVSTACLETLSKLQRGVSFDVHRVVRRRASLFLLKGHRKAQDVTNNTISDDERLAFILGASSCGVSTELTISSKSKSQSHASHTQTDPSSSVRSNILRASSAIELAYSLNDTNGSSSTPCAMNMNDTMNHIVRCLGPGGAVCYVCYDATSDTLLLGRWDHNGVNNAHVHTNNKLPLLLKQWQVAMEENKRQLEVTHDSQVLEKWSDNEKRKWWTDRKRLDEEIAAIVKDLAKILGSHVALLQATTKKGSWSECGSGSYDSDEDTVSTVCLDEHENNDGCASNTVDNSPNASSGTITGPFVVEGVGSMTPVLSQEAIADENTDDDTDARLVPKMLQFDDDNDDNLNTNLTVDIATDVELEQTTQVMQRLRLSADDNDSARDPISPTVVSSPVLDATSHSEDKCDADTDAEIEAMLTKLSVIQLKEKLKATGSSTVGKKAILVSRLAPLIKQQKKNQSPSTLATITSTIACTTQTPITVSRRPRMKSTTERKQKKIEIVTPMTSVRNERLKQVPTQETEKKARKITYLGAQTEVKSRATNGNKEREINRVGGVKRGASVATPLRNLIHIDTEEMDKVVIEAPTPSAIKRRVPSSSRKAPVSTGVKHKHKAQWQESGRKRGETRGIIGMDNSWLEGFGVGPSGDRVEQNTSMDTTSALEAGEGDGHVVLILCEQLQSLPWECLPCFTTSSNQRQCISRVPGLALLLALGNVNTNDLNEEHEMRGSETVTNGTTDPSQACCVIDPEGNLPRTRRTMEDFLQPYISTWSWEAHVGAMPTEDTVRTMLEKSSLFVYCGHGAGERMYDAHRLQHVQPSCPNALLWGCSSGKLRVRGVHDPQGPALAYLMGGAAWSVGNLWDVTDKDIDRLSMKCMRALFKKLHSKSQTKEEQRSKRNDQSYGNNEDITGVVNENDKENENGNGVQPALALAISRSVCKMKMAVGAAPVMYGLPQVVNL